MSRDVRSLLNNIYPLNEDQFKNLSLYHDLLLKWQRRINLVSQETIDDCWGRHFLDSLQLAPHIQNDGKPLIDFGSGAGFPGMVLAMCGIKSIHLIESDAKKIAFLKEIARITNTPVAIHHDRIENISLKNVGCITSRALTDLNSLLEYANNFVSHETICLFPKGKNYAMELDRAKSGWNFSFELIPSVTDSQSAIIKIFALEKSNHEQTRR